MRVIALIVRAGAVVVASAFVFSLLVDGESNPATAGPDLASVTKPAPKPLAKPRTTAKRTAPKVPEGVVAIVATGDIVMGSTPNLPSDGGRSFSCPPTPPPTASAAVPRPAAKTVRRSIIVPLPLHLGVRHAQ